MHASPSPADLAREYGVSRERITELLDGADAAIAATRIPACPDWSVHALCSHVTGIAVDLVGRRNPGADVQEWVDRQIAERADLPLDSVLIEWAAVSPQFEQLIEAHPAAFGGLLYDVVAHEHDLRHALGRPGARDSAGVVAAMDLSQSLLARDLRAHGLPAVRLSAGRWQCTCGDGTPELELDLGDRPDGLFEVFRILGSRRSAHQLAAYPWRGDLDRFLPAIAHMPLPEVDLVE